MASLERLSQALRRREERLTGLIAELGYPSYEACGGHATIRMDMLDDVKLGKLHAKPLDNHNG